MEEYSVLSIEQREAAFRNAAEPKVAMSLSDFEFFDDGERAGFDLMRRRWVLRLGLNPRVAPLRLRNKSVRKPHELLSSLGEALGFTRQEERRLLEEHSRRIELSQKMTFFVYFSVIVASTGFLWAPIFVQVSHRWPNDSFPHPMLSLFTIFVLSMFAGFLSAFVSIRLGEFVVSRHFADSLCLMQSMYILALLMRDGELCFPARRRRVVERIRELARIVRLLMMSYVPDGRLTLRDVRGQFHGMLGYIEEREGWAIIPIDSTRGDLCRDFRGLAEIFLSGLYGKSTSHSQMIDSSRDRRLGVLQVFSRVGGLVIPPVVLIYLMSNAAALSLPATAVVSLPYIAIAWLMLSLDAALGLGVVASAVSLAKGIKELK